MNICSRLRWLALGSVLAVPTCWAEDFEANFRTFQNESASSKQRAEAFNDLHASELTSDQKKKFCDYIASNILQQETMTEAVLVKGTIAFIKFNDFSAERREKYTKALDRASREIEKTAPINIHDKCGLMTAIWLLNPDRKEALKFLMDQAEKGVGTAYISLGWCKSKEAIPVLKKSLAKKDLNDGEILLVCNSLKTLDPEDDEVEKSINVALGRVSDTTRQGYRKLRAQAKTKNEQQKKAE